jgi:uncharacterized protein (DUF2164 family)
MRPGAVRLALRRMEDGMSKIELSKQTREAMTLALKRYLKEELDVEVAGFDATFLLDFISETLGPHYYNQGLHDAQALIGKKLELIVEAVFEIEKPVKT